MSGTRRLIGLSAATIAVVAAVNLVAFFGGAYRGFIDPDSSTGTFERAVHALRAARTDPSRDVLVLGDSRIYGGLDPSVAGASSGGLRFLNGGVPGTDPRCWFFFDRAIDPDARRFRAIVIPVDAYTDDTSALGSLDAADHQPDLHAVVFETTPPDAVRIARSFDVPNVAREAAFDLILRGPLLRDDIQAFAADPAARMRALRSTRDDAFDPATAHPFATALTGLRVDFASEGLSAPAWVPPAEITELRTQIFRLPEPSASYAAYRRAWLGPIVRRYADAGVPVVVVRIPARPVHRALPPPPAGSLVALARRFGAVLVPQERYVALERPELFADHDHLDAAGSRTFSAMFGRDVSRAIAHRAAMPLATAPLANGEAPQPHGFRSGVHAVLAALGVGVPLAFQSVDYGIFLSLVLALFYAAPRRARPALLLAASYLFYVRWNAWYLVFLLFLTLTDFAIGLRLGTGSPRRKRALLVTGVAFNLAFLASFKYLNFGTSTVAALLGRSDDPWFLALVVPVGISFHTFQSMSYLADVASGRIAPERRLWAYALYLAFFPQLLAGPIVRAGLFLRELTAWAPPDADDIERALREIALGLLKKLALADQFAPTVDAYFGSAPPPPGAPAAWCAAFAFAMQIYFDFSGYSDIAIGSARLFGFDFPENFRRPYLAVSVADFWRRWHISLSTWLRDYLYIPLGGNRNGVPRTYRNLMLTMLLGGLWHGANWTFVAWGGYHGALLAGERANGMATRQPVRGGARLARTLATFLAVLLGWVLFRAPSFAAAFATYRAMFGGGGGPWSLPPIPCIGVALALAIGVAQERGARWNWRARPALVSVAAMSALVLAIELASWPGEAAPFVYFKF